MRKDLFLPGLAVAGGIAGFGKQNVLQSDAAVRLLFILITKQSSALCINEYLRQLFYDCKAAEAICTAECGDRSRSQTENDAGRSPACVQAGRNDGRRTEDCRKDPDNEITMPAKALFGHDLPFRCLILEHFYPFARRMREASD